MVSVKEHCCGADIFFDAKTAEKEYRKYLKKGPSRVSSKLIEHLSKLPIADRSLIDVGGGIGALQWWFLGAGGAQTVAIDASSGYLKKAKEHAAKNGWEAKTKFIMGDFAQFQDRVEAADFVTLDKVICCYPDYEEILEASCQSAATYISLSYPIDGIISKAVAGIGALFTRLKSNSFQPYIHPVRKIREVISQKGYDRISHTLAFPWHVETYRRSNI